MKGLHDRTVLVTGGASGDAVNRTASELGVIGLTGDVSSETDVARYFGEATERLGPLQSLHSNAGIEGPLAAVSRS